MSAPDTDILSIAWSLGHRSESWLYDQIAHLKRHRVHVLTYTHRNRADYPYSPVSLLPPRSKFLSRIRGRILRALGLGRRPLNRRERRCLAQVLESNAFSLVQAHFAWVGLQVQEEIDKAGLPLAVWLYGSDVFNTDSASRFQGLLRPGRTFLCTSRALKARVLELGCPPGSVHVVHPGIRVPPEAPVRDHAPGPPRLVSVGRLSEVKAPLGFVQIARMLRDRGVRFSWRHLGGGPLAPQVAKAARRHGVGEFLRLADEVPHEEVLSTLRSADIMVHNAVVAADGTREAFGVALAEAAAAGLPIVSVDLGGIPEIVRDGVSGYLVEPGDLEGMASRIGSLGEDPELRRSMGVAGHAHALESFELTKQTAKLDALYDKLTARPSPSAED
ncbi:MAG: glycosyltransferase [Planctomycetota bacterium]